ADPYETFTDPFLRSRGALFLRPDFFYHAPGNGNLRGFRSDLSGRWALTANLELARSVWRRDRGILREVALEGFTDRGLVDTRASDRRGFFREAMIQLAREVAERTEQRVAPRRYFRPPGAADEIAFLASCTRCGDCMPVCPVHAIIKAPPGAGLAAGTPIIDP